MSITTMNSPVEIHIAPDNTQIHDPEQGTIGKYMPETITIEFWEKDGTFKTSITLDQLIKEAGRD